MSSIPSYSSVVEIYSYGKCMWLALALHDRYGWPIYVQLERHPDIGTYVAHAYVVAPGGAEVDVLGPQEHVDIFAGEKLHVTRTKFLRLIKETDINENITGAYIENELLMANAVIDAYVEPKLIGMLQS